MTNSLSFSIESILKKEDQLHLSKVSIYLVKVGKFTPDNSCLRTATKVSNYFCILYLNSLNANVVHIRHDADVACSGFSASYRQNH